MALVGDHLPPVDQWGVVPQRLRPQRSRSDQVERTRLLERVSASEHRVVLVQAPAGYGKTTTLSQIAHRERRGVAWITLDPSDADPVVLVRHIVRGLALGGVDVAQVELQLAEADPPLRSGVVPALASALDRCTTPFLLIVDELHLVSGASVLLLDRLIDLIPVGSTIALGGRSTGELALARRIVAGEVLEIDRHALAFDEAEARTMLDRAVPGLGARQVDDLLEVTERWPAGLHLGVLALRDHPDPPEMIGGLLSSDRRLVDYLHQEALSRIDPDTRRFLTEISVLERPTGALCDATTGRRGSTERLAELVASGNLFLSPVADAADTYRLHQLFAELLLDELRRSSPEREPELRRNAAVWKDANGETDAAVRQALRAGDTALAARIVYRSHAAVTIRGEIPTLRRWIDSFPGDVTASDGLLALAAGWAALVEGDRAAVEHHLDTAHRSKVDGPLPDGSASFELAVAALEMISALEGVEQTERAAALILDAGPESSPWWRLARLQRSVARVACGLEDGIASFRSAELDTRGQPSVHLVVQSHLALATFHAGDAARADQISRMAVAEAEEHGLCGYTMVGIFHCVASLTAASVGDPLRSVRHADAALGFLRLTEELAPRAAIQSRQVLAAAAICRGEFAAAAELVREAGRRLALEPETAAFHADQLDLEAQIRVGNERSMERLTAAEQRVLDQLPTHRSLEEIGAVLYISRNTVKTHTMAIYRKLGVTGRSEAVRRATELGLIDSGDRVGPGSTDRPLGNRGGAA